MGRREPLSLQSPVGEDTELGDLIEEVDSDAAFNEVEDQRTGTPPVARRLSHSTPGRFTACRGGS